MSKTFLSSLPSDSQISELTSNAYFCDSWSVQLGEPDLNVFQQLIKLFRSTPKWVEYCMQFRNQFVSRMGLKNLGSFNEIDHAKAEADYRFGDRIGIFTLIQRNEKEIIIGDSDRHLNVTLSVYQDQSTNILTVTTIVHLKNMLGRVYMLLVIPMHRKIVPATLKTLG